MFTLFISRGEFLKVDALYGHISLWIDEIEYFIEYDE